MALPEYPMMNVEDYLLLDDASRDARYEYLDGELRIEVYRREDDGWKLRTYGTGNYARLESLNIEFPVDPVYQRVRLHRGEGE